MSIEKNREITIIDILLKSKTGEVKLKDLTDRINTRHQIYSKNKKLYELTANDIKLTPEEYDKRYKGVAKIKSRLIKQNIIIDSYVPTGKGGAPEIILSINKTQETLLKIFKKYKELDNGSYAFNKLKQNIVKSTLFKELINFKFLENKLKEHNIKLKRYEKELLLKLIRTSPNAFKEFLNFDICKLIKNGYLEYDKDNINQISKAILFNNVLSGFSSEFSFLTAYPFEYEIKITFKDDWKELPLKKPFVIKKDHIKSHLNSNETFYKEENIKIGPLFKD